LDAAAPALQVTDPSMSGPLSRTSPKWPQTCANRTNANINGVTSPDQLGDHGRFWGESPPWILKFDIFLLHFSKKCCVLRFGREKSNFTTFAPPGKNFLAVPLEKIHYFLPASEKNPSGAHS